MFGFKKLKKGEIIGIVNNSDTNNNNNNNNQDNSFLQIRCTNGKEIIVRRENVKLQKSRSPIDAWPDAFIFFDRVLGLLRGLTASLDVKQSYLDTMTPFARLALSRYNAHETLDADVLNNELLAHHLLLGNTTLPVLTTGVDQLGGLQELLNELMSTGDILGCQVVVIKVSTACVLYVLSV